MFRKTCHFENLERRFALSGIAFLKHDVSDRVAHQLLSVDIDSDGDSDLVGVFESVGGKTIEWFENVDGIASFSDFRPVIAESIDMTSVQALDLDNDGDVDIIASFAAPGAALFQGDHTRLAWMANLGDGIFSEWKTILEPVRKRPSFADFDGDGDLDMVVIDAESSSLGSQVWFANQGNAIFSEPRPIGGISLFHQPSAYFPGDF